MIERKGTWESLWPYLLAEAARASARAKRAEYTIDSVISAVILARAAWEVFLNEFIEWRDLPRELKGKGFFAAIIEVHKQLEVEQPNLEDPGAWRSLVVLNKIRNRIIHHTARRVESKEIISIVDYLSQQGLPSSEDKHITWERLVLVPWTAQWACNVIAAVIELLESNPKGRRRAATDVQKLAHMALRFMDL